MTTYITSNPTSKQKAPIERMGPIRVAFIGIAAYLVIFLVSPVNVVTSQSIGPYLYIGLGYLAFAVGSTVAQGGRRNLSARQQVRQSFSDQQLLTIHFCVTMVAAIGAFLKLVDVFFVRGVSLAGSVLDRRSELDAVGANPISIVCAIVLPTCLLLPFTYRMLQERGLGTRFRSLMMHLLFLVPILGGVIISSSRSVILIYLAMYMLYGAYFGKLRVKVKTVLMLFVAALLLLAVTTAIFNSRLEAMNLSPLDSVYTSGYSVTVQPQTWIGQVMLQRSGIVKNAAFAYLLFCQYYIHGIFEFVYQYQQAPAVHLYGVASFNAFYKLLAFIMKWPAPERLYGAVTVHSGVYTTFFGPLFSDFGWLGMIYMTGLGALAQRMWQSCKAGNIAAVPFYMYLVLVIYCFPVLNYIVLSLGLYNLTACGLFFWLVSARARPTRSRSPHRWHRPSESGVGAASNE